MAGAQSLRQWLRLLRLEAKVHQEGLMLIPACTIHWDQRGGVNRQLTTSACHRDQHPMHHCCLPASLLPAPLLPAYHRDQRALVSL